jgi:hypothetical protein
MLGGAPRVSDMKISTAIASVSAAALLAVTVAAHAQNGVRHQRTRAAQASDTNVESRSERAQSDSLIGEGVTSPPEVSSPAGRPLPNVFRNCEHPAPRWCTHNY